MDIEFTFHLLHTSYIYGFPSTASKYWPVAMHLKFYFWLGLIGVSSLVSGKALDDVFKVKSGATKGSCDDYRTGQDNANLDGYFEEAQNIINKASDAFGKYNSDVQVQKLAKAFFGITPNDQRDGTASDGDADLLKHVQGEPLE